jgi:SOS-response transcriptional repressor LexA
LTLEQLAARVGKAKSYLSLIENGQRQPGAGGEPFLADLERALDLFPGALAELARWERTPPAVRREVSRLQAEERHRAGIAHRMRAILSDGALDEQQRTAAIRRLVAQIDPEAGEPAPNASGAASGATAARGSGASAGARPAPLIVPLSLEIPLINSVAAGYPREFTDLAYPARVADEYVRCPDINDPDAFAARVVGESMLPKYEEGDIVVFSPQRAVKDGNDCFARLEPDHESTFKRVYFEKDSGGEELVRLQPLNPAFPARVLARERVAALYAAVSVIKQV